MNDPKDPQQRAVDEDVAQLVRSAGRREPLPQDAIDRLQGQALAAWDRTVARRRARQRRSWRLAAALIVTGAVWQLIDQLPSPPIASCEAIVGQVEIRSDEQTAGELAAAGSLIADGSWIATAAGVQDASLAALRLDAGHLVRLDTGTRLRLASATRLELAAGAIYIDATAAPLTIDTALGSLRHSGTRYEIRVTAEVLRIRARDGTVIFENQRTTHRIEHGQELLVTGDGHLRRRSIQTYGASWGWIRRAAPPFDPEGKSLQQLVDWVIRENGWQLDLRAPLVDADGAPVVIHGSLAGLAPETALDLALAGAGLTRRLVDGRLTITTES